MLVEALGLPAQTLSFSVLLDHITLLISNPLCGHIDTPNKAGLYDAIAITSLLTLNFSNTSNTSTWILLATSTPLFPSLSVRINVLLRLHQ